VHNVFSSAAAIYVEIMCAPGWYSDPTGRHLYRWWSGGWRDQVADGPVVGNDPLRPRWRTRLASVLAAQLLLLPFVAYLSVGGTPYPMSRVGVTMDTGSLQVLNVACPGERLLEITLRRVSLDWERSTVLWSATGNAPLPEDVDLGDVLPELTTQTPLTREIRPTEQLSLRVVTSDLEGLEFPLDFTLDQVPDTGVLSFNGTFATLAAYRADVLTGTPCEDPSGKNAAGRVLERVVIGQFIAFAASVAIALPMRRYPPPRSPAVPNES
jgi:hypothetical protein